MKALHKTGSYYVLHSPFEWPSKFSFQFQSKASVALQLLLMPQIPSIDDNLISSTPKERNCFIQAEDQSEKELKYFKLYTKNNCFVECLANQTLAECGCVQFYMLSKFQSCAIKDDDATLERFFLGESGTEICGINDMICYQRVEEKVNSNNLCECYPACDELTYNVDRLQMDHVT